MNSKKTEQLNIGLHWFRRDLRVAGNSALQENFKKTNGHVLGMFFFDSKFLSRPDFSHNRFAFFIKTLKELKKELNDLGSDLLVLDIIPKDGFNKIFDFLKNQNANVNLVTWSRDYEPYARARDEQIENSFKKQNVNYAIHRDHLLLEPDEVFKTVAGDYYKVYSPFARKWFENYRHPLIQKRIESQKSGFTYLESRLNEKKQEQIFNIKWQQFDLKNAGLEDKLEEFEKQNSKNVSIEVPNAGSLEAYTRLKQFAKKINDYGEMRDIPSLLGTSQMSLFLKNGSMTIAQIIYFLKLNNLNVKTSNGPNKYLKELVWREFYYHILYHQPRVEAEAFNEKYNYIKWENNDKLFDKWKNGQTGFPIVDAGMRQLNQTGWMHNRVRMIVASFLTKDLLINWQWGEKYFMEKLLDGDLALNNGGWQWSASTGVDAQPYFRIFNPKLQSERFDPNGDYIKKYIPELKHLDAKLIHEPPPTKGYPAKVVEHHAQKPKALALFAD